MAFVELTWLIPLLPIIGLLLAAALGRKTPEDGGYFVVGTVALACVISLLVAFEFFTGTGEPVYVTQTWIDLGTINGVHYQFEAGYYVDYLTSLLLIVVSILCTLIVIYSLGYMHEEGERKRRYYVEMALFINGMLGMVVASNFLEAFIFWEIMGLCSYLLIGFWYYKPSAAKAAKKAFLVTRIGDVSFMLGIIILFGAFGTLNYHQLFDPVFFENANVDSGLLALAMLFFFGAAVGKSAQFPLHDWLPDAMEGPTTVSALIHAATMVKAGVFLVARAFPLMVFVPDVLIVVAVIGGFTAIFAASQALNNFNIKRVLAYSTLSQLGYMFLALGCGGYVIATAAVGDEHMLELGNTGYMAGMFHLMNHAFFKALLFLAAGAVIHAVHTEDMRAMGGLSKKLKITSLVMLIGALAISGIPPFSGFWSKDLVLESAISAAEVNPWFWILFIGGVVTAFLTAFYMFRLWFMTFKGEESEAAHHAHEAPAVMWAPLVVLAIAATITGLFLLLPDGGLPSVIYTVTTEGEHIAGEALGLGWIEKFFTTWPTYLSLAMAVLGIGIAYLAYYKRTLSLEFATRGSTKKVYDVLQRRYYVPEFYDAVGEKGLYGLAKLIDWFDVHVIDGVVNGCAWLAVQGSNVLRRVQTGMTQTYAAVVVAALSVVLVLLYLIAGVR